MPGTGTVHHPDQQDSQHSTLALKSRARPCLPGLVIVPTRCAALLCASFAQSCPAQGKGKSSSLKQAPHIPGAALTLPSRYETHPHPIPLLDTLHSCGALVTAGARGEGQVDKDISIDAKGMCKKRDLISSSHSLSKKLRCPGHRL